MGQKKCSCIINAHMCVNRNTAVLYLCIIMWYVWCHMLFIFFQLGNRLKHFSWLWMKYFENPVNKKAYKQLILKKGWIKVYVLTVNTRYPLLQVAHCYPEEAGPFPEHLRDLLTHHGDALDRSMRMVRILCVILHYT